MKLDPNADYNPYAPPSPAADLLFGGATDTTEQVLADRGTRLLGSIVDGLLYMPAILVPVVYMAVTDMRPPSDTLYAIKDWLVLGVVFAIPFLGLAIYQWYLIATRGQSLAKKWLGIQIVKVDGSPVDFVSGVVLRNWVLIVLGFIPYIGGCAGLIDALMIFGDEKRCLHDHIAGTKVIVVPPGYH